MAIGTWEPEGARPEPRDIELPQLRRFIELARGDLEELGGRLAPEDLKSGAGLMQLEESSWAVAQQLDTAELEALIRFFTRAEMELSGWEGGKRSPVIWLVRILRARDAFTPELRRWIKRNTENRYLPYGSVV